MIAKKSRQVNGLHGGLTPLGAAAYPGSSVRTLRRAPLCVPSNPLHTT